MSETMIHAGGPVAVQVLDEHGWTQGTYDNNGAMCLHGVLRRCTPVPGDAYLIEQVEAHHGRWSTDWNDAEGRTADEVRAVLAAGWDITDEDLAATFGPQWRAVVGLVRRAAILTPNEAKRLRAAWDAARDAAGGAARGAAWDAAGDAARVAAGDAAGDAARDAAGDAAWDAAWAAARDAAVAVVTWDLATDDGPYLLAHRDLLVGPWVEVCGLPEGLIEREDVQR